MSMETVWLDYDVIVIGSGGAGSAAAHAASGAGASVLVVAKDPIGCSDSKIAEGIVAVRAVADDNDSHEVLADNLRLAGGDLPTPEITQAFAEDSEDAYDWLRRQEYALVLMMNEEPHVPFLSPLADTRTDGQLVTIMADFPLAMPLGTLSFRVRGSITWKMRGF